MRTLPTKQVSFEHMRNDTLHFSANSLEHYTHMATGESYDVTEVLITEVTDIKDFFNESLVTQSHHLH